MTDETLHAAIATTPEKNAAPFADFFARARARLDFTLPPALTDRSIVPSRGDHETDKLVMKAARELPIRPAAVLIPVVEHADEPSVLLTLRASHLSDHPGQVAFPGGKIDAADASPLDAALREAEEEIGLARTFVEPLGFLDVYATSFGFRIIPVVARVRPGFALTINRDEVDDAFEVPLSFLMTPDNHLRHSRDFKGITRSFYAMPYQDRYIWGVTAGIVRGLYERIVAE